jgi:hypothetical protein
MTRLEEIKNKYGGTFLLHVKKDSPGMDIVWLIEKLEKAIEILSWKETYIFNSRALRIKREFLKELE